MKTYAFAILWKKRIQPGQLSIGVEAHLDVFVVTDFDEEQALIEAMHSADAKANVTYRHDLGADILMRAVTEVVSR